MAATDRASDMSAMKGSPSSQIGSEGDLSVDSRSRHSRTSARQSGPIKRQKGRLSAEKPPCDRPEKRPMLNSMKTTLPALSEDAMPARFGAAD